MSSIEIIKSEYPINVSDMVDKINQQLKDIPSILDKKTIQNFQDGKYEITLKEYTDMSTYRTTMNALYGNKSASKFPTFLGNILQSNDEKVITAKDFMDRMKEKGVSQKSAIKLYSALKSYSITSSAMVKNFNFISAKI